MRYFEQFQRILKKDDNFSFHEWSFTRSYNKDGHLESGFDAKIKPIIHQRSSMIYGKPREVFRFFTHITSRIHIARMTKRTTVLVWLPTARSLRSLILGGKFFVFFTRIRSRIHIARMTKRTKVLILLFNPFPLIHILFSSSLVAFPRTIIAKADRR